ncbi:hypothetical protein SAMN02745127_01988, partial [Oceanospirillum multiglobuliferum]
DVVTLTVNGNDYTGEVFKNDAGNLVYKIDVLTDDLETDNSIDASVTTTDVAGNIATAAADRNISLDGDGFGDHSEVLEGSASLTGNLFDNNNHFGENPQIQTFEYTDENGTQTASAGETVTTLHGGELKVNMDGQWSYTPPESADHSESDTLGGAGFKYTASIDGGGSYTAYHDISVLDQEPEALADHDNVTADEKESTSGNVLTGIGGNTGAALQGDNEGPDNALVTEVRFGDRNVSFNNETDIQTDINGNQYIEIEGDNGLLKLYQDGTYNYEVTSPTTTRTVGNGDWSAVELKAFNFGTAYKDVDGKLQLSQADGSVSVNSNGLGVEGSQNGMPVGNQINHDADTGESEALAVNFTNPVTQATVSVSNLYRNDNGGETGDIESGRWEAFDLDGNLVGFGILDSENIDYRGHGHQGTAVIELPDGGAFSTLVFTSTAYDDPLVNTEDSSDYFIRGISYQEINLAADEFTYVITDSDGDNSESTLTIDMTHPESNTITLPDPVEASITIDVIAGDDVLNVDEALRNKTTITGSVGHDVQAGDTVTLTVNGEYYKGDVFEDNGQLVYKIDVDTNNLEADNEIDASVSIKNSAGETTTATASREINTEFSFKLFAADAQGEILLDGDGNPVDATEIAEPGTNGSESTGYYIVKAVDSDGKPLSEQPQGTVDVTFINGNNISNADYSVPGEQTVNVNTIFTATANDDALSDSGEQFIVALNNDSFTNADDYDSIDYDSGRVTTTILDETDTSATSDNDTAFTLKLFATDDQGEILRDSNGTPLHATKIAEPGTQNGDSTAYYTVKAVDSDGNLLANQPEGEVDVSFHNGHNISNTDYSGPGTQTVTIGETFTATANDDALSDNGENFTVSLNSGSFNNADAYEAVGYDNDRITTTILDETSNDPVTPDDNDSAFTLKLFAADDQGEILRDSNGSPLEATEIAEPGTQGSESTGYYVVKAVDADGNPLTEQPQGTVDITFANGNNISNDDYSGPGVQTVNVGETFKATANDDAFSDSNESFTVSLNNNSFSNADAYESVDYDNGRITTTILDETSNDPATLEDNDNAFTLKLFAVDDQGVILRDSNGQPLSVTEIAEPGTQGIESTGYYAVKAVGKDGNPLADQPQGTVVINFANGDNISNDDYSGPSVQTVNVGEIFTATANDDVMSDSGEKFTVSLNENSFSNANNYESVNYDDGRVTTTILDEVDTHTPNDNDSAFTLRLFASDDQGEILLDDNNNPVEATQIHEDGATSAYYVVKALDENGNFVDLSGTVSVRFNNNSAEHNDYTTQGTQVTLGQPFSATATNDSWSDNGETFTVELVENTYSEDAAYQVGGKYETVDYDGARVTTTIRDIDIAGVEDNRNTQEGIGEGGDWNIAILENLEQIHSEDDFSSITISGIPSDATLKDGDGNTLLVDAGEYTATNWQDALNLTITPAEDSSKDIRLDYNLTLQDGSIATFTQSIVITPEADQPWTLGDLASESVTYQETLLEDTGWVSLDAGWSNGSSIFDELTASTGDADGSESNTVVRFFSDGDTHLPNGTQIRFENSAGNIQTYTFRNSNSAVDIPADKLDSLQIKTPSNFNGELSLKIKTGVIDRDEDSSSTDTRWSDSGKFNQAWGEPDILKINVSGDADLDANLISVTSIIAPEDSGRDQNSGDLIQKADGTYDVSGAIDLEINYRTGMYTNTEIIEVKIEDIPADTFIFAKDGTLLNGDGTGGSLSTVKIVLDPTNGEHYTPQPGEIVLTSNGEFNTYIENLKLIPAHDSNEDFTLTLNQKSTEPNWDGVRGEQTKEVTDTFEVQLTSVADNPIVSGTDTPIALTESGAWQNLSGFQIASGEEQHFSEEVYALIRNVPNDVGLRIVDEDGNELLDQLVLANADANSTDWRIDNETLQKIDSGEYQIQLKTPDVNMSGSLEFGIRVTVLDIDPDSGQQTNTLVSDHTMNIVVKPDVEAYSNSHSYGNEDEWIKLDLSVGANDGDVLVKDQYDYNGNTYDLKIKIPDLGQTGEDIQVNGNHLVIDYNNNIVYLNQEDLDSVEVLPPLHSDADLSGIQLHRYLKDDMDDGSTSDKDIQEVITDHTVIVTGIADGWEDVDNTANSTTDDTTESNEDGFVVEDIDGVDNINTALTDIVSHNNNIEDSYHDTVSDTDTSESEYYIIRDQSGAINTTWMVESGINAGNGVWIVPADSFSTASIKILQSNAGDGSLDLEIVPVSKENDGDILFDQAHTFTIQYAGGSDTIATEVDGSLTIDGSAPTIVVSGKNGGQEDTQVNNVLSGTAASGAAQLSYVIKHADNGSVDTSGMYKLPNGHYVGTGEIDFNPNANFNGDAGFDVDIIATDSSGNQSVVSETIILDIDPVLDIEQVSAQGGTEIDNTNTDSIDLNIQISSSDIDGSESLQGDVRITPQNGGQLTGTDITDNGDGSYTIASENLSSVAFVPDAYSHGTYSFEISYTWTDTDANGSADVTKTITDTFSINIASEVDQIEVSLTPVADIDEAEDYPLDLAVLQHDSDGSEIASIKISGIPDALIIQDANGNRIGNYSDNGDGTVNVVLRGSEIPNNGLSLHDTTNTYGGTFTAGITAFSLDKVTKEIAQSSENVTLTINPVASAITEVDVGSAQTNQVIGTEDTVGMPLDLDVIMTDLDGSEKLQITFGDEFADNGFSAFYADTNGDLQVLTDSSFLTPGEAQSIQLVPPANYSGDFNLTVNVRSVEVDSDGNALDILADAVSQSVQVSVAPEADSLLIGNISDQTVSEDASAVNLGLDLTLNDADELLNITLNGLEPGSTISVVGQSVMVGNTGTASISNLTEADAETLSVTPPENYSGTMNIGISIKTIDGGDILDTAVTQSFSFTVTPEADQPVLDHPFLSNEFDNGDGTFSYDLELNASLTDGSEELSLRVDGLPAGSTLTNSHGDNLTITDGSITLTLDQLSGLKLITPDQLISDGVGGLHIEATAISTETMGTPDISDDSSAIQTRTIVDGVMDGLAYTSSSGIAGFTDELGTFSYVEGDSVTFKIGDVVIGEVTPEDLSNGTIFLQDMADVDRSDLNDEYVENMGVFLQSLDEDENPDNGITITPKVHAAFEGVDLDLRTASEADVKAAIELAGKTAISEEQAMAHVQRMLEQYAGLTSFEAHTDDSIVTANLANEPIEGLRYETSSGLSGDLSAGSFQYDEGDTVNLYVGNQLVANFTAADVGDDNLITFDEAGFQFSQDELERLISDLHTDESAAVSNQIPATDAQDSIQSSSDTLSAPHTEQAIAEPTGFDVDDSVFDSLDEDLFTFNSHTGSGDWTRDIEASDGGTVANQSSGDNWLDSIEQPVEADIDIFNDYENNFNEDDSLSEVLNDSVLDW